MDGLPSSAFTSFLQSSSNGQFLSSTLTISALTTKKKGLPSNLHHRGDQHALRSIPPLPNGPSPSIYAATIDFYALLGFRVISKQDTEAWLHLFPPADSLNDESGTDGVTLRIGELRKGDVEKIEAASISTMPQRAWGCFVVSSLESLENSLKSINHPYSLKKATVTPNGTPTSFSPTFSLISCDPLGTSSPLPTKFPPSPSLTLSNYLPVDRHDTAPPPLTTEKVAKRIGILTSGGDSSGMNAAKGCVPFAIYEGYEGLVDGGAKIKQLCWDDVRGLLSIGGTAIGTARSMRFRTHEGRLQAAYNMILNGIDALVVVGGDGSLTGADKLRSEWKELVDELVTQGKLKHEECEHLRNHLTIVGLVGSIDNDMSSTDITIGAVTSLHRICESLDSLTSTALSHQRAFVVEVMGVIAVGADWVFLPERPPPLDTASTTKTGRMRCNRKIGSRKTIVIVCEGAIDRQLKPIKPEYIKTVIESKLGLDTRVTTLGHVQRGGTPCAYDRYLATIQGVEAVEAVLRSTPETPAPMIGMSQNKITALPLMDAVKLTKDVADAISKKDLKRRWKTPYRYYPHGRPAGGMNAATRIAARLCLNRGHTPLGIRNGFSGLIRDEIQPLTCKVSSVGKSKAVPSSAPTEITPQPPTHSTPGTPKIHPKGATGFAFTSLLTLSALRECTRRFCVPMVNLPATISNNVPGTDFSIGSDTALNAIVESCDRIKLSASASQKRVFVVEVQGGNCGYLAVLAGLASGATSVYIPEEGINIDTLQRDIKHLANRYATEKEDKGFPTEGRVILRSEFASADTYPTEVISSILRAEGKGVFDSRTAVLGHLQQGGVPSPLDRIRATRLAVNCVDWIEQSFTEACEGEKSGKNGRAVGYTTKKEHAVVIGIQGAKADMAKRRGKKAWWMGFTRLIRVLSKYYYHDDE
ncbi:phosphofructokinase-domain-containing protein [Chytridium lagenaria]|nr:phosphofructokinase-domain-containing protein [Chytridium lagenaria]